MTEAALPARAAGRSPALGLLLAARPRQWLKGALVFAAPVAAGRWVQPEVAIGAVISAVAFTLTAAGCYLFNDVHDAAADRAHPAKRLRPVAAGWVAPWLALLAGAALILAGPLLAFGTDREELGVFVVAYAILTTCYTGGLKNVPGLELLVLASGFVLRPLAGAAGTGVPPSTWFLAVCCAGALMVALGKRYAEVALTGAPRHRPVLAAYRPESLRLARAAAAAALTGAYLGWALTRSVAELPLAMTSAVLIVAAVLRYSWATDRGRGGEPERLVLTDRVLATLALAWAVCFLVLPLHA